MIPADLPEQTEVQVVADDNPHCGAIGVLVGPSGEAISVVRLHGQRGWITFYNYQLREVADVVAR